MLFILAIFCRIKSEVKEDDEEFVEMRFELPREEWERVSRQAGKRGMSEEDYLSVVVQCYLAGTVPRWKKAWRWPFGGAIAYWRRIVHRLAEERWRA